MEDKWGEKVMQARNEVEEILRPLVAGGLKVGDVKNFLESNSKINFSHTEMVSLRINKAHKTIECSRFCMDKVIRARCAPKITHVTQ